MTNTYVHQNGGKKCVFCKYWYDPTNSAIKPVNTIAGVWSYDEKAQNICTKKNIHRIASATCPKFESKM